MRRLASIRRLGSLTEIAAAREKRLNRIMAVIRESLRHRKKPPTFREIKDGAGVSSTSIVKLDLDRLEGRGLLRLGTDGGTRGIELVLGPDDPCPYCGAPACARP
jgi:SOS-response transcriptional repressor LexA